MNWRFWRKKEAPCTGNLSIYPWPSVLVGGHADGHVCGPSPTGRIAVNVLCDERGLYQEIYEFESIVHGKAVFVCKEEK